MKNQVNNTIALTDSDSLAIAVKLSQIDAVLALLFEHFSSEGGIDIDHRNFESFINGSQEDLKTVHKLLAAPENSLSFT